MRADRLIALLLFLQHKSSVTAAEVAEELEVSVRTARRDLEALAMSGVPIYSTPGRGGGWQLIGGARTDLTGLSADEARALFLATGSAAATSPELHAALRKLSHALPEPFQADAEAASSAIKVDPNGWGQIQNDRPPFQQELIDAILNERQVELGYTSPRTGTSTRAVSPLGLVTKRNVWYLVAHTAKGIRTFRLNRITALTELAARAHRPEDFALEAEWERIVSTVETKRGDMVVTIAIDPAMLRPLQHQFYGRIDIADPPVIRSDGRVEAVIAEYGPRPLAAQLAGYGNAVTIDDPPPELVAELQRITSELHDTWGSGLESPA